jgi:hypothetical protein
VDVDHGQLVGRGLDDIAIVMRVHEFAPVGGVPAGGGEGRRFEALAHVRENLPDRGRMGDDDDEVDISGREWVDSRTHFHR